MQNAVDSTYSLTPSSHLRRDHTTADAMGGQKRVDGETVALKKRKRDKIDDERRSSKKHRSKSRGQVEASASTDAAPEKNGGICEGSEKAMIEKEAKMDALSYAEKSKKPDQQAALWTLSKPMGGRMLNIDPIFSVDERFVPIRYRTEASTLTV